MRKNNTFKRFLAFLLCAAMIITYMPSSVYTLAEEDVDGSAVVQEEPATSVVYGDFRLDKDSRRVFISDKEINLTAKEFDLLELLASHPNKVYSREQLLEYIWGGDYPGDVRTVDVHIRRLREKIEEKPSEPGYVHTKWGVGYYFQS